MGISREDLLPMAVCGIVYALVLAFVPRSVMEAVFDPLWRWIAAPGYWWFALVPTGLLALVGAMFIIVGILEDAAFKRRR